MAYSESWDEAAPPGSSNAATIDTIIQLVKTALRERLEQVIPDFGDDLIDPKRIVIGIDVVANRPAAIDAYAGEVFYATDETIIYVFDGTDWVNILEPPDPNAVVNAVVATYDDAQGAGFKVLAERVVADLVMVNILATTDASGDVFLDAGEFTQIADWTQARAFMFSPLGNSTFYKAFVFAISTSTLTVRCFSQSGGAFVSTPVTFGMLVAFGDTVI